MITKINFDTSGNFNINGILKLDNVDFEKQQIDSSHFYPLMVQLLLEIKKTIYKNLADDQKILGDERVQVMNAIDKFLTMLFSFAFITSKDPANYSDSAGKNFEIEMSINKTSYINGRGKIIAISTTGIKNIESWIDDKIIGSFKRMISLFNDLKNREEMKKELINLIYHIMSLRYKIEYI